ncbi:MAG: DEAD/DEAH box helicase [Halobacteriovoraceae bacterium]|nr:DEAD/DEAH box helicase [Halobacteriovoraceae bacterium]|tara:strand:- start:72227 stop:73462 length:1236 start_codon:yes stop_codon:yes gene_type:complete
MSEFSSLDLLPEIKKALKDKGYEKPTPIQAQSIPHLLEGKDLLGIAQTGTGKTAAFSLPLIDRLAKNKVKVNKRRVRSLILTPTRELASQIEQNIKGYSKGLGLKCAVIFGGVGKQAQMNSMAQGVDILVATPGRLLDLMSEGHVKYDQLEVFVLDEADRMLDMGFLNDVKKVISKLPRDKQTLLFSATMPKDIASLANSLLNNPKRVEVTPESTTVEKIEQKAHFVAKLKKPDLLKEILKDDSIESMLVFTRTKHGADRVVKKLAQDDIMAAAIHGNKSQRQRESALGRFKDQKIRVLVATDIAARGIDIPQVSHVINYNPPEDPKSYVHRIGRTGRAGRDGVAILFCDESEVGLFNDIQKHIKIKIPIDEKQPFHEKLSLHPDRKKKDQKPKKKVSMSKKARRRRSFRG